MKPKIFIIVTVVVSIVVLFSLNVFAQPDVKSTGIGLRGSYYQLSNGVSEITVLNNDENSSVNVGGGGGWIYLFSRVNNNLFIELSIGGIGHVEEETNNYCENNVDVSAITPLLLGLRQELLSPLNQSTLRPYFSFGAGPYWISDVIVRENCYSEEVSVKTTLMRGGYAGGGFDFKLCSWLAVNFDVKYHFIDFNKKHELSGFDYGLGVCIMWGSYKL